MTAFCASRVGEGGQPGIRFANPWRSERVPPLLMFYDFYTSNLGEDSIETIELQNTPSQDSV